MKALVVGASGQVGDALVAVLERHGVETHRTRFSQARGGLQMDVRDAASVRACLEPLAPDWVFLSVNIPGGVDYCEEHPEESFALQVQGTQNVLDAAAKSKAKVVYISSDYIFDGKSGPYSEEDAPAPISVYGKHKWEAEERVRKYPHGFLILRTTAVFSWDRASKNFAMRLSESLQAGRRVKVSSDQWCNPTLAEYLAEAGVQLVQSGKTGVYNVAGKTRITRAALAEGLAKAMGLDASLIEPVPTAALGRPAKHPLNAGLKMDKLREALGTEPLDLAEQLKRLRRQWRADTHVAAAPKAGARGTPAEKLKQEILAKVREYHALAHKPAEFVPYKSRVQYSGRVYGHEEMTGLVDSALDFWLTLGPYGDLFESKMKRFFGSRDFVLVNSGSTANLTAVMTLMSRQLEDALKPGDEVITPAVTFPTTLAPLVHGGLVPVLVDCEIGTYNIDPALAERAVTSKTRALFVPHTLGNPCDMDALADIAKRHKLWLIEDSCDALGSKFRGRLVGTFGELATLSFFPAHHITMGEGGGVVVNAARLSRIVRSVRDWGRDCWCAPGETNTCGRRFGWQLGELPMGYDHKYIYSNLGYNFKPTDMQAAIGVAQADRLEDFTARRKANFKRLYEGLKPFEDRLILPRLDPRSDPSWFALPITVQGGTSRKEIVQWLENANIETREVFGGNILKQPAYRGLGLKTSGSLEQTDRVMNDTFFIGVYPGLTEEMIAFILKAFEGFFAQRSRPIHA